MFSIHKPGDSILWTVFASLAIAILGGNLPVAAAGATLANHSSTQPSPQIVQAILDAIPRPAENQFPTPESVIRFFVTQVQRQDADEAAKALPIHEDYESSISKWSALKDDGFIDFTEPFPGAPLHNSLCALRLLNIYEKLSVRMLGIDVDQKVDSATMKPEEFKRLCAKLFYRSPLKDLKLISMQTVHTASGAKPLPGYSQKAFLHVSLECGEVKAETDWFLGKHGTNWRVLFVELDD